MLTVMRARRWGRKEAVLMGDSRVVTRPLNLIMLEEVSQNWWKKAAG